MTCPRPVSQIALPRRIAQCMALVVVIGILTVLGCSNDDDSASVRCGAQWSDQSVLRISGWCWSRSCRGVRIATRTGIYLAIWQL